MRGRKGDSEVEMRGVETPGPWWRLAERRSQKKDSNHSSACARDALYYKHSAGVEGGAWEAGRMGFRGRGVGPGVRFSVLEAG